MPKGDKIPHKRQLFVKHFTDIDNPVTFGNATQSVLASYPNVKSADTAKVMGNEILTSPNIQQAIEKRISTKDEDQQTLTRYVDKLDEMLKKDGITQENTAFIREMRELIKLNGQFRGDFIERSINLNVNLDRSSLSKAAQDALGDI